MRRHALSRRATTLGLAALLLLALGPRPATEARAAAPKAAMLFPGSISDQSWNASGYAGLEKIRSLGFDVAYSENVDAADHVDAMRDYARQGFGLIIGHSGRFLTAAERVGPEHPGVQFVVGAGAHGNGRNVMSVDVNNRHFGCLLGVLAAGMSRSGIIGGVYGLEGLPTTIDTVGSLRICARMARPGVVVKVIYVADMESAAEAKEAALSLVGAGADVLTGQLNAGETGLLQAARERSVFVTGRSTAQTAVAPAQVLTNVVEKWPEMYAAAARGVMAGHVSGATVSYGFDTPASSGAMLAYAPGAEYSAAVPASLRQKIDLVRARLAAGTLKVQPNASDARAGI